jgi:hypothetical protein
MTLPDLAARRERARHLLVLATPGLWPVYPFLPVTRRTGGAAECGLLFDAKGVAGVCGYSATVFLANLFARPGTLPAFLALPRQVFDTPDEVYAAGWRVD